MEKPFFQGGLRFECMRCSRCCRFTPGYVFLSKRDLKKIAHRLKLSLDKVTDQYCRIVSITGFRRLSLKEKDNLDCIFWTNGKCTIYAARPLQCQSYPFWESNLISQETWDAVALSCPGIGKGPVHSEGEILNWLKRREDERLIVTNEQKHQA